MTRIVDTKFKDDVGWITINNPPVNATSTKVRAGLHKAIEAVKDCKLAVLSCEGRTFIAGGDMSEFDAPPVEPHLPDIVNAIEASSTPFLAILHGNVLGGGFEIAMACAFRVAKPGTYFGLPEVNLGLVPGAGGTQRAPRLLGWSMAIDMACLGKRKTAEELLAAGSIDAISDDPELTVLDYIGKSYHPVSDIDIELPDAETLANFSSQVERAARGKQAPIHNFHLLQLAAEPFAQAQPKERALHLDLRQSDESRALRHVFFAERMVSKPAIIQGVTQRNIQKIAIVGGGLMGSGIATACLNSGCEVCIIERDAIAASKARETVEARLEDALSRKKITSTQFAERCASLITSEQYECASDADVAIEAVFEDIDAKRDVFATLSKVMRADAVLATNTSYLNPDDIFSGIENLERCIGIHFFSPAHVMKLVEVVTAEQTSHATMATAFALANKLGKTPVASGICDGFIGNRILASYRRAAEYLLADGALPKQVDTAMRSFGMAMGPFEAQDMSGLQIAIANRRRQDATRNPAERYVPIADRLCADGRLGQRTGRGWYRYEEGKRNPVADPDVEALIIAYAKEERIHRRAFSESEIQSILLAAMANEGAHIVDAAIAENEAAVDVVKTAGYGFPKWKGGPMYWVQNEDPEIVANAFKSLTSASPGSWVLAERFK
jgi:3-hydroxyacyl-CoA dehydrogenase